MVALLLACGGSQQRPYVPEPTPKLPAYAGGDAPQAPATRQATPPAMEDARLPPPADMGPSCRRLSIGPTKERPRPIDYAPIYPIEVAQHGRATEGLETQARRVVRCFYPGFEATDIVVTRDEQHRGGSLSVAIVGVRGPGCETYELELELHADWARQGTRLDVRRSTIPQPSGPACGLNGGWKTHAGHLGPWQLPNGNVHGALGLAILVYSAFHPGTARTASCVLDSLRNHTRAQQHTPHGDGRFQRAGLRILQQLLRVEPGEDQLVTLAQDAAAEFDLGIAADGVRTAVLASKCFGGPG
ncbi:MAG: hypothetical protein OXU20_26530 [Myxococcales bacterium]|nr:hypothetical protein [Myxococcales bacterium]